MFGNYLIICIVCFVLKSTFFLAKVCSVLLCACYFAGCVVKDNQTVQNCNVENMHITSVSLQHFNDLTLLHILLSQFQVMLAFSRVSSTKYAVDTVLQCNILKHARQKQTEQPRTRIIEINCLDIGGWVKQIQFHSDQT